MHRGRFYVVIALTGGALAACAADEHGAKVAAPGPPAKGCPNRYEAAASVRACGKGYAEFSADSCAYPEGECTCMLASACGGAQPMGELWTVVCRPRHRTDGCPDQAPPNGSTCTTKDKVCTYDLCGYHGSKCDGARWVPVDLPGRP